MQAKSLVLENSADFFNILIKEGFSKTGVQVSALVKNYVSRVLQFYIFSDHLFSEMDSSGKKQVKTLAELYLKGQSSPGSLRNSLKKMGDMSLYISGFFREYLTKKLVSVDYYMNMGKQAYGSLSDFQDKSLFEELSTRFSDLVFVLLHIRKTTYRKENVFLDPYRKTRALEKLKMTEEILKKEGPVH